MYALMTSLSKWCALTVCLLRWCKHSTVQFTPHCVPYQINPTLARLRSCAAFLYSYIIVSSNHARRPRSFYQSDEWHNSRTDASSNRVVAAVFSWWRCLQWMDGQTYMKCTLGAFRMTSKLYAQPEVEHTYWDDINPKLLLITLTM